MKAIVIYKSNTGFTKKYAEWIAKKLSCEALPIEGMKRMDLSTYDTLVFGGWSFAGNIQGLKELKEKIIAFQGKKAVFATGAMPADAPEDSQILKACFSEEEHKTIGTFFMQGGLDYSRMGMAHKAMMKMMCKMLKKEKGIDSTEYKAVSQSFDATDKEAIRPLINYVKETQEY